MGQAHTEHSETEVSGFKVTDSTHTDPAYQTGELIWVGLPGEGRWLTATEASALAAAITAAATAAAARASAGVPA